MRQKAQAEAQALVANANEALIDDALKQVEARVAQ